MQKIYFYSRYYHQAQKKTVDFKTGSLTIRQQNRDRVLQDYYLIQAGIVQGGSTSLAFSTAACFLDAAAAIIPGPQV